MNIVEAKDASLLKEQHILTVQYPFKFAKENKPKIMKAIHRESNEEYIVASVVYHKWICSTRKALSEIRLILMSLNLDEVKFHETVCYCGPGHSD